MKGWGRQCIDLEKVCHWKEKTLRVSMLNVLHFQACYSQDRHMGVRAGIGLSLVCHGHAQGPCPKQVCTGRAA